MVQCLFALKAQLWLHIFVRLVRKTYASLTLSNTTKINFLTRITKWYQFNVKSSKFFNVVFVLIYLDGVSWITKWYQYNVKISKIFNVIFVLIYLDGISSLWKKALFRGKGALFEVVHLKIFGTISRWHYSRWHYSRYYCRAVATWYFQASPP